MGTKIMVMPALEVSVEPLLHVLVLLLHHLPVGMTLKWPHNHPQHDALLARTKGSV